MYTVTAEITLKVKARVEVDVEDIKEAYSWADDYFKNDFEDMLGKDNLTETEVLSWSMSDIEIEECEPNINEDLREY